MSHDIDRNGLLAVDKIRNDIAVLEVDVIEVDFSDNRLVRRGAILQNRRHCTQHLLIGHGDVSTGRHVVESQRNKPQQIWQSIDKLIGSGHA